MSVRQGPVSRAVAGIQVSGIKDMAMRSAKVEGAASLTWGVPSFRTPAYIRRAVERALHEDPDVGKYTLPDGLRELQQLAAEYHRRATGVTVDPRDNVLITAGNMQGVSALLHLLLDPGDEIIVTDPGFASHVQQIKLCGGEPVYWALHASDEWNLHPEALPDLITERTRGIILVSPSNPTGKIFAEADLRRVGEICRARGVFLIIDDPYSHFTYENRDKYFNLASVPELADGLAYCLTFSKTYAMSGWRLGFTILPAALKPELIKVQDASILCPSRVAQVAGIAALGEPSEELPEFQEKLAARRRLICERLDAVPHVFTYTKPEGAYYVFPRIEAPPDTSRDFAIDLLDTARVAVTPGAAFGPTGEHHVRMAYCVEEDTIDLAFDRIEQRYPR